MAAPEAVADPAPEGTSTVKAGRRRIVTELVVLAILAVAYLTLMPGRQPGIDAMFALLGLGAVGATANHTRERVWGPQAEPVLERLRSCGREVAVFTVPVVLLFGGYGAGTAYLAEGEWSDVLSRLFGGTLLVTLAIYIPWAWVQQTLFQFYLLGRLRALLPGASPLLLSCINGILFGAVHLPAWDVTLVAMGGGAVWSHSYHRHRSLPPLALSHAVLGATYFSWVRNSAVMVPF
jgi:hypothetical protein